MCSVRWFPMRTSQHRTLGERPVACARWLASGGWGKLQNSLCTRPVGTKCVRCQLKRVWCSHEHHINMRSLGSLSRLSSSSRDLAKPTRALTPADRRAAVFEAYSRGPLPSLAPEALSTISFLACVPQSLPPCMF